MSENIFFKIKYSLKWSIFMFEIFWQNIFLSSANILAEYLTNKKILF